MYTCKTTSWLETFLGNLSDPYQAATTLSSSLLETLIFITVKRSQTIFPIQPRFGTCYVFLISLHFISFQLLILVVKSRILRKDSQRSEFRCVRKTPENYSRENPPNQVGTENPIHKVPPLAEFETRF